MLFFLSWVVSSSLTSAVRVVLLRGDLRRRRVRLQAALRPLGFLLIFLLSGQELDLSAPCVCVWGGKSRGERTSIKCSSRRKNCRKISHASQVKFSPIQFAYAPRGCGARECSRSRSPFLRRLYHPLHSHSHCRSRSPPRVPSRAWVCAVYDEERKPLGARGTGDGSARSQTK